MPDPATIVSESHGLDLDHTPRGSPEGVRSTDYNQISIVPPSATSSRVTSWTNSTHAESLNEFELERKRLSVIREDGSPHQPSSSAGIHIGGISVLRKPMSMHRTPLPDTQRLYSALIKRIDEEDAPTKERGDSDYARPTTGKEQGLGTEDSRVEDLIQEETDQWARSEQPSVGMTPEKLLSNLERRKERIKQQQMQSSFFPHSNQGNIDTVSPFRRFLDARKNSQSSEDLCPHDATIVHEPKALLSSESVYSRTTQGGLNSEYEAPRDSQDDLGTYGEQMNETSSYAIILPRKRSSSLRKTHAALTSLPSQKFASQDGARNKMYTAEERPSIDVLGTDTAHDMWEDNPAKDNPAKDNPAKDNPAKDNRGPRRDSDHSRTVRAKLSARLLPGRNSPDQSKNSKDLHMQKKRFPLLDVKQVNRITTPAPSRSSSRSKSQFGILQSAGKGDENAHSPDHGSDTGLTASLRKMSPGGIAKFVRSKRSMPVIKNRPKLGKENRVGTANLSVLDELRQPPLRSHSGSSTVRLKKAQSQQFLPSHCMADDSPIKPSEALLSSRLSRPFDMDTPIETHYTETVESRALGLTADVIVNPRIRPKERSNTGELTNYGGLGPAPFEIRRDTLDEDTALPKIPTPSTAERRAGAKTAISIGSKRMVSNFLKSRRRNGKKEEAPLEAPVWPQSDSPRFL